MKKSHGPAFKAQQIDLVFCPTCKGKTFIKGVFHDLALCPVPRLWLGVRRNR